jgi:DNA-binding transcriptional LysR family regulator
MYADADPIGLLRTLPFIRYDRNHWGGHVAEEYLSQMSINPLERSELDALEAIAVMVSKGLGIWIVPDWAPPWQSGLEIVKLPLKYTKAVRTIGIIATQSFSRANLIAALLKITRG